VILDLGRFVAVSQPRWRELEAILDRVGTGSLDSSLDRLERFYQLYERACADLARLSTFAAAPEVQRYLESLVARAYAEVHETRRSRRGVSPWRLLAVEFPRAFRRRISGFNLAVVVTLIGVCFGGMAVVADPDAKSVLLPFQHLQQDPAHRVEAEESSDEEPLEGPHASFAANLIHHNTRVGLFALALGMTFGIGTMVVLFYNGVILGAVCIDYIAAGESVFLAGWLLPHGAVEIPAFLIAGQAGVVLGRALLAGRARGRMRDALEEVRSDLVALAAGFAALLVWAGIVESFLSQLHSPVFPYPFKIALGVAELVLLTVFLTRAGRARPEHEG
jgi:uncharacterized membrane protein SpoIIM required for sporulation